MATDFGEEIISHLRDLRAFAHMLARDPMVADDLVQETVLRALSHSHQFHAGTNLKAWLTTILRNVYFTQKRRENREAQFCDQSVAVAGVKGGQDWHLYMRDFTGAFGRLPAPQREALMLIGVREYSYEQAAKITGYAEGTMKSRVSRARSQLHRALDGVPTARSATAVEPTRERHLRDWQHLAARESKLDEIGAHAVV